MLNGKKRERRCLMAKLKTPSSAGYNAGKNYFAKMMRIEDIVTDLEISKIFNISDTVLEEITQSIMKFGYNSEEPIVIWKGTNILVDGRTRLTASKKAGLKEVPIFEKEFADRDEAMLYTFERQANRRNLTGPEILTAARMVPDKRAKNGEGRAAEQMAKRLGISNATMYQAIAIAREAPEEIVKAVEKGDISVKKGYTTGVKKPKHPETEFSASYAQGLPDSVKFLRGAVILLTEANQSHASNLLINHFLKKHDQRDGFYKLLPENIRKHFILEVSTS
jgi:ParB-like chromosome segregation protein Spo0J